MGTQFGVLHNVTVSFAAGDIAGVSPETDCEIRCELYCGSGVKHLRGGEEL